MFADLALPPYIPFLNWAWDDLLFLILAGIMLGSALFVVLGRNIVRSGLAMMACFAALAGHLRPGGRGDRARPPRCLSTSARSAS